MHKLNVRILGPSSFISTLNELKIFLKFNPLLDNLDDNSDIILFHIDALRTKNKKTISIVSNSIKICAGKEKIL